MARAKIDVVDIEVGQKIRSRRNMLRMSQTDLGARLGLSFQQIQKYEKGRSRIGAGRLAQIADALGVSVTHFFPDADTSERADPALVVLFGKHHTARLVESFSKIKDSQLRRSLITVIEKIVAEQH